MAIINKSHYLVHSNNNKLTMQIIFEKNEHKIFYQFLENNIWSEKELLNDTILDDFTLIQLSTGDLYLFYKNLEYNIVLTQYKNDEWSTQVIVENNSINLKFLPVAFNDQLFIFFQNYTKENNTTYLFYQSLDDNLDLSTPVLIDKIKFDNTKLLQVENVNELLYVFYINFNEYYFVGFKSLDLIKKDFSNFHIISSSKTLSENYEIKQFSNITEVIQSDYSPINPSDLDLNHSSIETSLANKNITMAQYEFESDDNFKPVANDVKNLKLENIKLQRELNATKRKFQMLKNKFMTFYNQITKQFDL